MRGLAHIKEKTMINGLAITPPVLGRISIGRVVEKNGKRLPAKDDQFTITSQVKLGHDWLLHPLDEQLRAAGNDKLRSIPVQLLFNDAALNLRAEYSLFDRSTGRPFCVGNGVKAKRVTDSGLASVDCPAPEACELGRSGGCKPYGRLNVKIEGQDDDLGTFIFRTTGFNSIRTLSARLGYFAAVSGNRLASMPLMLKLRAKSSTQSYGQAVYYVDLTTRDGLSLSESIMQAIELDNQRRSSGFNQTALDEQARLGFSNGQFEETEDEIHDVLEEFYSTTDEMEQAAINHKQAMTTIADKLNQKIMETNK
jgi:hypothetical protein